MRQAGDTIRIDAYDPLMEDDILPLLHSFFPEGDAGGDLSIEISEDDGKVFVKTSLKGTEAYETVSFVADEKADANENRRELRKEVARTLYLQIVRLTGRELPWGMLTGVRPTKLVLDRLEKGLGMHATYLMNRFCVTKEKATLAVRVARKECMLLNDLDYKSGFSLYVGIPFCASICNYCTFGAHPLSRFGHYVEPYLEALAKEIRETARFMKKRPDCIYIGGGTPTILSPDQIRQLIALIRENFDTGKVREFSFEAGRPDSITKEKLEAMRDCGITRISINPQSMVARTLETIGRAHTPEQITEAFAMARECGFDNINADLIAGLSGETPEDFKYTLSQIEKLRPESLTVHTLAHKRAARLTTSPELYKGMEAKGVPEMVEAGAAWAKEHGMEPYYLYRQKNMTESLENIGYSVPGKECLYNVLIMEERQMILALGAGASSKFVRDCAERFARVENVKSVKDYIERIDDMIERKRSYIIENNIMV
ncbi:MAG: coproporphyrinogen dehydrogenase HemZ [Lachnospiraceae bacterium]|nr:coproporphyrinogen dehydrogenase HemZ [Lachnospiraceae bacterium]